MCLAIPGRIIELTETDPLLRAGRVSFGGIVKSVNLAFTPEAQVDDHVLVHVGFAISTIDEDEAARIFDTFEELGEFQEPLP